MGAGNFFFPRPVWCHLPSDPVPFFCPPWTFLFGPLSASSSSAPLFFHPKMECTFRLLVSLLHFFSLLIRAGIEPHPGPVQDPCSVWGSSRVYSSWVAFYGRCATSSATAAALESIPLQTTCWWPALWSCPTCSILVPPAGPTRKAESSNMDRTRPPCQRWWWWTCHFRPPLHPLQGARWWHITRWRHGRSSGSQDWPHLWGKNPLQLEGDYTSLQQAVYCLFCPAWLGTQKLMMDLTATIGYILLQTVRRKRRRSGRPALPPPRRLTGLVCSPSAILMSSSWPSWRSSSTSQLPELTYRQFGRTPS